MTGHVRAIVVLGLVLVYAVCAVAIKAGLGFAPPLLFAGLRAFIGGVALLVLALALRQRIQLPRRLWPVTLLLAVLATSVTFAGMFLSPGRSGAAIASVLGNLQPLIVILLAAAFLKESFSLPKVLALGLGLIGVLLISTPALITPGAYGLSGAVLALAASVGTASGSVIVKRIGDRADLLALTGWQLVVGGLPLLICGAFEPAPVYWQPQFIALLLFLGLAGTALTSAVWYWLVRTEDDLGHLSLFLFLIPVVGVALAYLVFHEQISVAEMAGVALVVSGIAAAVRTPSNPHGLFRQASASVQRAERRWRGGET